MGGCMYPVGDSGKISALFRLLPPPPENIRIINFMHVGCGVHIDLEATLTSGCASSQADRDTLKNESALYHPHLRILTNQDQSRVRWHATYPVRARAAWKTRCCTQTRADWSPRRPQLRHWPPCCCSARLTLSRFPWWWSCCHRRSRLLPVELLPAASLGALSRRNNGNKIITASSYL